MQDRVAQMQDRISQLTLRTSVLEMELAKARSGPDTAEKVIHWLLVPLKLLTGLRPGGPHGLSLPGASSSDG